MPFGCSFRLLTADIGVSLPDGAPPAVCAFLANTAVQDVTLRHHWTYSVTASDGGFELREGGDRFGTAAGLGEAARLLDARLRRRLHDYLTRAGWLLLDAGLVRVRRRRCVVLGDKTARTSFLAQALLDGHPVDGPDVVAVRGGLAVAVPAALLMPVGEGAPHGLPVLPGDDELCVLTPPAAGVEWHADPGAADAVVVLEADDRTPSGIAVVLHAQLPPFLLDSGTAVREAAGLLRSAQLVPSAEGLDGLPASP